jgi:serine/threonine-protein kinase
MPSGSERVSTATWLLLQTALIVTAGLFARRNLRLGRGDRRGATRLALFVAAVLVVRWIVVEHHVPTAWEMALFDMFVGTTLYAAALVWIFYIAIEPSVRRRWPHTLVSWTRIVAGRWRDPLVGRELLLGCATGCIIASLYLLAIMAPSWVGYPRAMLTDMPDVFLPGQSFVAGVLFSLFEAIFSSLAFFCLAFFLHLLLRNAQLTMIVWTLIVGSVQSLSTMSQSWWISAPLIIVALLCMYLVMIRAGWVPLFVGRFVGNLLILCPLTFDSSVWHAEVGYAALSVIGAIGFYGCWTSLGGRPILSASVNSP